MIHVITEQSWSTANGNVEGQPLAPRPRMMDTKPSREAAEPCAIALSAKFHHHGCRRRLLVGTRKRQP